MKNLIYKELKLYINFIALLLIVWGGLVLIPSWPYSMAFIYVLFSGIQPMFSLAVSNKDAEFTSMLPLSKNAFVASKHFTVAFLQLIQVVATVPFAIISSLLINKNGNPLSLDASFTLFAVALIGYSVFNIIFLPWFFKTGHKIGLPLIVGLLVNVIVVFAVELLIAFVPVLKSNLDSLSSSTFGWQILALIIGAVIYAATILISYKKSCKNFCKVNL